MANPDNFIKNWRRIHKQTRKILVLTPNDKYDWKPAETSMPLGELANHFPVAEWGLVEAVFTGKFPADRPEPHKSTDELVAAFDKTHDELVAKVRAMTPEQLEEEVTFGPDMKMTRMALLNIMTEHEIHHRGQLYVYLRILGCELPSLF